MDILCKRLKQLREDNGLTQTEFGKLINVQKGTVSYYESGRNDPPIDSLMILADHFNISLDYFVGHDNYVISEDNARYGAHMSNEEIKFIKEIRKDNKLHSQLMDSPENLVNRMKIKL